MASNFSSAQPTTQEDTELVTAEHDESVALSQKLGASGTGDKDVDTPIQPADQERCEVAVTQPKGTSSIESIPDRDAGGEMNILNPVQCSATGMEPEKLKERYGERITFWGGGVDTQRTLPFGTSAEVKREVIERCRIFSPGGGFVFTSIHNVQALTPLENVLAMLEGVREFNSAGR